MSFSSRTPSGNTDHTQQVAQAAKYQSSSLLIRLLASLFYMITGKSVRSIFRFRSKATTLGMSEVELARISRNLKRSQSAR